MVYFAEFREATEKTNENERNRANVYFTQHTTPGSISK